MNQQSQLLTIDEAREILRVGRNVMYELIRTGGVPHIKIGKQIRIPLQELEDWVKRQLIA
ncbi:helix-turn-helix domain-containing protein [Gorillibacterium sp. sgz5001074]|uniref:helix-turn-helix domain-containing protein n=1 Tax=Gorillibacterium sp. sgz5001074 TaxID=3446695 RepID=UPI003F67ADFF